MELADGCVCAAEYSPLAAQAVHRFKFYGRWHYAKTFAALLAPCAAAHLPDGVDAVTFVPGRAGSRCNPAELLARELCRALALPAPVSLLRRTRRSPRQSTLPQERRKANALGLFALRPGAEVSGLRVLLVDDVCTTGATLSECARMLRTGGASFVLCAAFARSDLHGGDARPTA